MLASAPSLEDILFSGLTVGIAIGQIEKIDGRWCKGCQEYVERTVELATAAKVRVS
jgi:hypothetical protein